jgi:amidohydrolase
MLAVAMNAKESAQRRIAAAADSLVGLSRRIHQNPELGFEEVKASAWLARELERGGLDVALGVFDLPTALFARAGSGPLRLAVCAEYDALPEIGHACGHNLIAATALGTAIGLREVVDDLGITLEILGTPAEEFGNGKALLLERGAFDGVDAAMMVHPAPVDVLEPPLLAFAHFDVEYSGEDADAFAAGELRADAAAALTIAQVAIGFLRPALRATDRVHGIVTHAGTSPERIADRARGTYMVRARDLPDLGVLEKRVRHCFEAAALATGTDLAIREPHAPYAEMRHDRQIAAIYRRNAEALGRQFPDLGGLLSRGTGSTDMGNVSQVLPAIHPAIGIDSLPAANHQPEFTAHCVTPAAERSILDAAAALAGSVIDIGTDEELRNRLMARHEQSR